MSNPRPKAIMALPAPPTPPTPSATSMALVSPSKVFTISVREVTRVKSEMPSPPPTAKVKRERQPTIPPSCPRSTPLPATPRRRSSVTPKAVTPFKTPRTPISRYARPSRTPATYPRMRSRQPTAGPSRAPSATPTLAGSARGGSFIRGGQVDAPIDFENISAPPSPTPSRRRLDSVFGGTSEASFALSSRDSPFIQSRPFALPNQRRIRQGVENRQTRQSSPTVLTAPLVLMPSAMKEAVEAACHLLDQLVTVDVEAEAGEVANTKSLIAAEMVGNLFSKSLLDQVTATIGDEISREPLSSLLDVLKRHLKSIISGHQKGYQLSQQKSRKSSTAVSAWLGMWRSGLAIDADSVTMMTKEQALEVIGAWSDAMSGVAQDSIAASAKKIPALNAQNYRRWRHVAINLAKVIIDELYRV